jgi:hypothetical protein
MLILKGLTVAEVGSLAAADPFVAEGARAFALKGWSLSSREHNHLGMGSQHAG